MKIFRALAETEGNVNLKQNYIVYLSVLFTKDKSKLMDLINQLPADVKANTTHYIQDLIIEGREEEREKTKRKAVKNMLAKNFPIEVICEIQEVPEDFVYDVQEKMTGE